MLPVMILGVMFSAAEGWSQPLSFRGEAFANLVAESLLRALAAVHARDIVFPQGRWKYEAPSRRVHKRAHR